MPVDGAEVPGRQGAAKTGQNILALTFLQQDCKPAVPVTWPAAHKLKQSSSKGAKQGNVTCNLRDQALH